MLEHTVELIERLGEIRQLGVTLAIDDFGTGFSSLSYLRKLPVAVIKIDKGFTCGMLLNDNDRILAETMIAMAHKLGHRLVAEGVEEEGQRARLAVLGCEVAQGLPAWPAGGPGRVLVDAFGAKCSANPCSGARRCSGLPPDF